MSAKTYKVGNIEITEQAFLVLLAGTTLAAMVFVLGLFVPGNLQVKGGLIMASLFIFGLTCWQAWVVNCTIIGKCTTVAWILSVLFVFAIFINAFSFFRVYSNLSTLASISSPKSPRSPRSPKSPKSSRSSKK